ncbi:hypothetical protein BJ508DRAFT_305004 [Ascobolus immersus RN42]|uniref:Uncharacterized protein n=1 Tax=Ascobolus immersus RN42 TaxID=1160509 RepID=A0A3N4IB04_ASCIM|nr:hypothetical protein BJ508DRAFT_305004 [Ascobolus immersus RN42]
MTIEHHLRYILHGDAGEQPKGESGPSSSASAHKEPNDSAASTHAATPPQEPRDSQVTQPSDTGGNSLLARLPDELRIRLQTLVNVPLSIVGVVRTIENDIDEAIMADAILMMKLFSDQWQDNIESQSWIFLTDPEEIVKTWTSGSIIHGPNQGPRVTIPQAFLDECIESGVLHHVEVENAKKITAVKIADAVEEMEEVGGNALILFFTHGVDELQPIEKGTIVLESGNSGDSSRVLLKKEIENAITKGRNASKTQSGATVTVITISCFGGMLTSEEYNLVAAASRNAAHYPLTRSLSGRSRGTPFTHSLDGLMRDEFNSESGARQVHLTDGVFEAELKRRMDVAEPGLPANVQVPALNRTAVSQSASPVGVNIPPRLLHAPSPHVPASVSPVPSTQPSQASATSPSVTPERVSLAAKVRYWEVAYPEESRDFSHQQVRLWIHKFHSNELSDESARKLSRHIAYCKWWNRATDKLRETIFGPGVLPIRIEQGRLKMTREEIVEFLKTYKSLRSLLPHNPVGAQPEYVARFDGRQLYYMKKIVEKIGVKELRHRLRTLQMQFKEDEAW